MTTWEKSAAAPVQARSLNVKFMLGIVLLLGVGLLIASGTLNGAQYFIGVNELLNDPQYVGQTVRISGAVVGETIVYDGTNLIIDFTIADIPKDTTNLALTLYEAVRDPGAARLQIHMEGHVKPDLLQNEAQAILTGELGSDGIFYASEVLLKCPSRYEENVPQQAQSANGA